MQAREELSERKLTILHAIIQTYLETGEPVGSRTISKHVRQKGWMPLPKIHTVGSLPEVHPIPVRIFRLYGFSFVLPHLSYAPSIP